nr:RagB/SusD family nutrient uptake outer membrane protein [uncultured Porphyromonas sp.]
MKKYVYIIAAILGLVSSSCSKDFLDTAPTDAIGKSTIANSTDGLYGLLNGIHNTMYLFDYWTVMENPQGFGIGYGCLMYKLDYLGDDFINTQPAIYMGLHRYQDHTNPRGEINERAWLFNYEIISHANLLIKLAEENKELTVEDKNVLLGEGYTFRAMAYHMLVQLFGKRYVKGGANDGLAVPLRLDSDNIDPKARATVSDVYKQIDSDIAKGLEHLKDAPAPKGKNAISYSAACGIAAKIALTKYDYATAEKYATEAINKTSAKLQVGKALLDGFNNVDASEWIWGYAQASDQSMGYWGYMAHVSYNFKAWQIEGTKFAINRDIYDKMGPDDARRGWFVCIDQGDQIPADANKELFNNKWEYTGQQIKFRAAGATNSDGAMNIMRLSELYYIKAEAEARQGKDANAQKTLQAIMITRDPEYNASQFTGQELIDEVMRNKRIDHWGEGLRFFDIKRLGIVFDRSKASNYKYLKDTDKENFFKRNSGPNAQMIPKTVDDPAWEFAIPYDEIKSDPELIKQNQLAQ